MASESQSSGIPTGKLVITMRLEDDTNETIFQAEKTSFFNGQPSATLYRAMDAVLHDCGANIIDRLNLVYPTLHDVTDGAPSPNPSGPSQSTNTPNTTTLGKRRRSDIPLPSIEDPAEFEQPKRARTGSVDRADSIPNNGGGDDDDKDYNEQPIPEYSPCYRPPQTPETEAEPAAHSDEQDEEDEYLSRISGTLEPGWLPGPDPSPSYRPHSPDMEPQPAAHVDERRFAPGEQQHPVRAVNNDGYHGNYASPYGIRAGSWHVAPDQARIPTAAAGRVVCDVNGDVVDDDGWNSSDTLIDDDIDDEEDDDDYEEDDEDEEYEGDEEDEEEEEDDDDEVDLFIGSTPYAAGLPVDYLVQETREQRMAREAYELQRSDIRRRYWHRYRTQFGRELSI
ncbi:hypothetical protein CONLIGDRAFT_627356 [Coniochaeta ligniaria NRRL 30616]|uniref:Uncharacterized protein n=1 Tax=Coniochaeta ligniaria NRRL 30616 TaxID=1408157 RepID=A0A1J7J7G2_9PEZI|nr:hypothetical protein CONLIGDRAFT_627356 [Coniochaeta ligniaria NRRL 30616]